MTMTTEEDSILEGLVKKASASLDNEEIVPRHTKRVSEEEITFVCLEKRGEGPGPGELKTEEPEEEEEKERPEEEEGKERPSKRARPSTPEPQEEEPYVGWYGYRPHGSSGYRPCGYKHGGYRPYGRGYGYRPYGRGGYACNGGW